MTSGGASAEGGSRAAEIAAGREALARGAWEEARARFAAALEAGERAEALEGLGWALWWLDRVDESFAARERAFLLYSQADDRRRAARVAIHLAVDGADMREPAVTSGWLERAATLLAALPPGAEHAWLELWRGHVRLTFEDDWPDARRCAEAASSLARATGERDLELLARALDGLALVKSGAVADGMRRLDEATAAALSGEISDLDSVTTACCFMVYACEHVKDYDRAAQWHRRVEDFSRRWRIQEVFAGCRVKHAQLLVWQGRWAEAEALLLDLMRSVVRSRRPAAREAAAALGDLRRRQGRAREAAELFARGEALSASALGTAELAYERDDARTALDHLERAARRTASDNLAMRAAIRELSLRAHLRLGESDAAREDHAALEDLAARAGTLPLAAAARLGAARLAAAEGRHDASVGAFEDAVDLLVSSGAPYEAARAREELSAALAAAGRGDRAKAEGERAREALRDLGVRAGPAGARPARGVARPTARELEVLRLVAEGLSDAAIAARLDLSQHTVHRHVANLLAKLDCGNRAAAVSKATRLGYV